MEFLTFFPLGSLVEIPLNEHHNRVDFMVTIGRKFTLGPFSWLVFPPIKVMYIRDYLKENY